MALAIDIGEGVNVVKPFARQHNFPVLLDQSGSVFNAYTHNHATPLNYVIDPNGIVRYWGEGFDETSVRNTIQQWFPVDHDVGVTKIMAPLTSYDSGTVVTPACSLFNYGLNTETYDVRMKIGPAYDYTATITAQAPGTAAYATFPDWTALARGPNAIACSTQLVGDLRPSDDQKTSTCNVTVYDVAITAILAPVDSVDSSVSVTPSAIIANPGNMYVRAKLKFSIGDFYLDSVSKSILPAVVDTITFTPWTPGPGGTYPVQCTVVAIRDLVPNNNVMYGSVRVVIHTGISEDGRVTGVTPVLTAEPNPLTQQTVVRLALPRSSEVDAAVYSADGRLVRSLFNGRHDAGDCSFRVTNLAPGIYYCRVRANGTENVLKLVRVE